MSARTAQLLEEALSLEPDERVDLAERLLRSLDSPDQKRIDERLAREVEDRLDAFERGEMRTIPAEEVFDRIEKQKTR